MKLKGIYKIPEIKHSFIIVSPLDPFSYNRDEQLQKNRKEKEYFEHILRSKHYKKTKEAQLWKLKIVDEHCFVKVLEQYNPKEKKSSNQTYENPDSLELLCINSYKNTENKPSKKYLGLISNEDIIEVFI